MAIGYRGKSVTNTGVSGNTLTVPVPTGTLSGDRMYCVVGSMGGSPAITDPAGWQKLAEYAPGTTLKSAIYQRNATGSEPASYTWTFSSNGRMLGMCVAYSGVDLTATTIGGGVGADDPTAPTQAYSVAVQNGDWVLVAAVGRESPGTDDPKTLAISDPADVERYDVYSSNTGTGADVTGGWWDTGRPLTAQTVSRTVTPAGAPLGHLHLWTLRIAAPVTNTDPQPNTATWSYMGIPQR